MNKFLIGAGVATLVAVPALALQHGAGPARPDRAAPITRVEVQARVQQRFAAVDANRDGVVTRAEIDARRQQMRQQRQAARAEHRTQMFAMLDTDKNGQLSRQEFTAGRADRGPDRAGGPDGHGAGMGRGEGGHAMRMGGMGRGGMRGMGDRWLERADANQDGKLTLAEATAKPLEMFDQADANKDGTVTPEERRAARGMLRQAWQKLRG